MRQFNNTAWRFVQAALLPLLVAGVSFSAQARDKTKIIVNVPGTYQPDVGCDSWDPNCPITQMALDPNDNIFKITALDVINSPLLYVASIGRDWEEEWANGYHSFRRDALYLESSLPYPDVETINVRFYYDDDANIVQGRVIGDPESHVFVASGDFQSEIGCSADNDPACMRTWLHDADGDGLFTSEAYHIPPGTYTAQGVSNEGGNQGPGDLSESTNAVQFTIHNANEGKRVRFVYDPSIGINGGFSVVVNPEVLHPVVVDGMSQDVFRNESIIQEELFVDTGLDTDLDGESDRVNITVRRPSSTELGSKLSTVIDPSPYSKLNNDNFDISFDEYLTFFDDVDYLFVPLRACIGLTCVGKDISQNLPVGVGGTYFDYLTPRGFVSIQASSIGTGHSDGCPTLGDKNESLAMAAVVDWLNGRKKAYDEQGNEVIADWSNGSAAMMGLSYQGTLPNGAATTNTEGLKTIIPMAAISDWYEYYHINGLWRAGGDQSYLFEFIYNHDYGDKCDFQLDELRAKQDQKSNNYSEFWKARDYRRLAAKINIPVYFVHGLNDFNVKMSHSLELQTLLAKRGVPTKMLLHQGGHTQPQNLIGDVWYDEMNHWLTRWLVLDEEVKPCYSNCDQKVAHPAIIQREDFSLVEYDAYPDPKAKPVKLHLVSSNNGQGGLVKKRVKSKPRVETLLDPGYDMYFFDGDTTSEQLSILAALPESPNRLVYMTEPLKNDTRVSGKVNLQIRMAVDSFEEAANINARLVDFTDGYAPYMITFSSKDPQNRFSRWLTQPIRQGQFYTFDFDMEPHDYVFKAGSRIGLLIYPADTYFGNLLPMLGRAVLKVDTKNTKLFVPIVGGKKALKFE